jgi:NADH dehydrogenase
MSTHAVTGATSYTGRFIAGRLRGAGDEVVNLTRAELASPDLLAATLDGVDTLYNTFWIRFERGPITYAWATERCVALFAAARRAGVRRIVHISVINASAQAPTAYFRAKAAVEQALIGSGVSHAIVRPTVTFGPGDILLNNLAWTLRRLPLFGIPGDGRYPIQPVHVDDIADLAVVAASLPSGTILDAAGPDRYTFREFVALVREAIGSHALVIPMPVAASLLAARIIGLAVRDVVLRRDEVTELQAGLMCSADPPTGHTRLADWLAANGDSIGRHWANELDRHFRGRPGGLT